jgi:glutamate racemase
MIGVFDSGFGGLTILKSFLEKLPEYDYIYLGDNARAPYGNKSHETICQYTCEALRFLFAQGCDLVIIACNSASAEALRQVQQEFLPNNFPDKKVLGVVIPVVEGVTEFIAEKKLDQKKVRVGIIGTRATITAKVYEKELAKRNFSGEIFSKACPLLVPLVEENWTERPETKTILKKYLQALKTNNINILILACTHYPILFKQIQRAIGRRVLVLNSPEIVAEKLKDYLARHQEIEGKLSKNKKRLFYTTDDEKRFFSFAEKFLNLNNPQIEKVKINF